MKKILLIIFIICMVFIIFISFFFIFSKEKDINNLAYFDAIDLKTNIKDTNLNNKIDISKYEDKIIKDNLYSVEYTFFDENKSLKEEKTVLYRCSTLSRCIAAAKKRCSISIWI